MDREDPVGERNATGEPHPTNGAEQREQVKETVEKAVEKAREIVAGIDVEAIAASVGASAQQGSPLTRESLRKALSEVPVDSIVDKIVSSPSAMGTDAIKNAVGNISVEDMARAKDVANSEEGKRILAGMMDRGVDIRALHRQTMRDMAENKGLAARDSGTAVKLLLITTTRKIKEIMVEKGKIDTYIKRKLGQNVEEVSCRRLAQGPWVGLAIYVWYDLLSPLKDTRRLSRMVGFTIKGSAVVVCGDRDLTEREFTTVEGILHS